MPIEAGGLSTPRARKQSSAPGRTHACRKLGTTAGIFSRLTSTGSLRVARFGAIEERTRRQRLCVWGSEGRKDADEPGEVITGSAAQLHRVHQAPRRFTTREAFDAFDDPGHQKLFMSVRVAPTGRPGEHWLVLEHATRALRHRQEAPCLPHLS